MLYGVEDRGGVGPQDHVLPAGQVAVPVQTEGDDIQLDVLPARRTRCLPRGEGAAIMVDTTDDNKILVRWSALRTHCG